MAEARYILLVEDNPDDEMLTMRALRRSEFAGQVVVVQDGAQALDYLFGSGFYAGRDVAALPELILLDLKLPKIHGLEVLRRIRADRRTKLIPVVILSSSIEDQDMVEGYSLGANSYIRKSVDFDEFHESVRKLQLYWSGPNEPPPPPNRQ